MGEEFARRNVRGERRSSLLVFEEGTEQVNEEELEKHATARLAWQLHMLCPSLLHDQHIWQLALFWLHLFRQVLPPCF